MFDPTTVGVVAVLVLLALIALRVPIAVSLISVSVTGIWLVVGTRPALNVLTHGPYDFAASWTLSSIPMFLLMGYVAYHSGLTSGLFQAARAWLGWLPGGLLLASLAGAGGFAAVTGSSVACSAAMGKIAIPELQKSNYNMSLATGALAAGGTLGALIPPSILLILYGIQAQVPISNLFLAGLYIGLASLAAYFAISLLIAVLFPHMLPRSVSISISEKVRSLLGIWPIVVLFTVVIGGLFSGFFTATEAGAAGALTTILLGLLRKTLTIRLLKQSIVETLLGLGSLMMVAVGANAFTRLIALTNLSDSLSGQISAFVDTPMLLLAAIAAIYLVIGMFLEPIGAMLLTLPILLPIAQAAGVDLLLFGIFSAKLLEIGMITPPVGLNLFVIHSVAREHVRLEQIIVGVLPYIAMDLVLVGALIFYIA